MSSRVIVCCVLALAGCAPSKKVELNQNLSAAVEPGVVKAFDVDAVPVEQTVKVSIEATAAVSVYLVFAADAEKADRELDGGKSPSAAKDKAEKKEKAELKAVVPANTGLRVIVKGEAKSATVKVHITN